MKFDKIEIGDTVPLDGFRKPFGGSCVPSWYILTTGRQRRDMIAASAWLTANGAAECWFPEDVLRRQVKRNGRLVREKYQRPVVPGIVFMLTDRAPRWDVMLDRKRIRPMQIGDRPVAVSDDVMAKMSEVPDRIEGLRRAVAEAEAAARLAVMPRAGEPAEFTAGPFRGHVVMIESVAGCEAVALIDGIRVRANVEALERRA